MFARCASPSPLRRASSRPLLISAAIHSSAGFWKLAGSSSVPISKTRSMSAPLRAAALFGGRGPRRLLLEQLRVPGQLLFRQRPIFQRRKLHPRPGGEVERGAIVCELAHAEDEPLPLGDADRAAGVEQVEGVRALQAVVIGGQRQLELDQPPALLLVFIEEAEEAVGVARVEAVLALLALVLPED